MYSGPHIKKDGLVFGYDTGYGIAGNSTATRFYKGVNITNTSNTTAISTYWNNSGTAAWSSNDTEVPRLFSDLPVFSMEKLTNGSSHIGLGTTSATVSTIYTYSIYIWIKPGNSTGMSGSSPYFRPQPANVGIGALTYNGSSSWNTWPRGRWIRITRTATTPTNVTSAYISCYLNTAGDKVYFTAPQFTSKNFLSPFVNGTRSSTQSLIDLTKTTNIDVSNVSFDSTGQPTFDGTNDYIPLTGILNNEDIGASSQYTINMWLNCDSYGSKMAFSTGQNGDNRIYYWTSNSQNTWRVGNYTSTAGHSSLPSVGNWFNTTLVINGTNIIGYLNGVEDYTGSYTGFNTQHYATFGRHGASSSYYFDGKIANAKIYNRALSADEVQQNFKAYKNRFDI